MKPVSIIRETVYFFTSNFLPVTIVAAVPVFFLWSISLTVFTDAEDTLLKVLMTVLYLAIAYPISTAGILLVSEKRVSGEAITWSEILRRSFRVWWPLLALTLFKSILVVAGFILLVVPGIWLYVRFSLAEPMVVLRGLGPNDALESSFKTTDGVGWTIFWVLGSFHLFAGAFGYLTDLIPVEPAPLYYLSWALAALNLAINALLFIAAYRIFLLLEGGHNNSYLDSSRDTRETP